MQNNRKAFEGSKSFVADIVSHDEENDTVTFAMGNGSEHTFERKALAKISTVAEF